MPDKDLRRTLLEEDKLSMGHARALMNTPLPLQLALDVIRKGLNVRQTEKLANALKGGEQKQRKPRQATILHLPEAAAIVAGPMQRVKDPDILALEQTLSENLGLKVAIEDRGQSGDINISYESLEQLDEILRRLGGSI